jgi:hypothetical protein
MPNALQPRKTRQISDSLHRRLNTYAQMASAAGVSLLALTGASEAKVVYTETNQATRAGVPLYIDLNGDGIKDFVLRTVFYRGTSGLVVGLDASGFQNANNLVAGRRYSRSSGYFVSAASALPAGAPIGPKANFSVRMPFMAEELFGKDDVSSQYSDVGPWVVRGKGVTDRYLGLKFVINGKVHYGWARLSVALGHRRQFGDVSGTLTGYAYETIPDKAIIAGEISDLQITDSQITDSQISGADVMTVQPDTLQPETLGGLALGRK